MVFHSILIYKLGSFVFDEDVNDAVILLKKDRSADVR